MKTKLVLLGAPTALLARAARSPKGRRKVDCTTEPTQFALKTKRAQAVPPGRA